MKKLPLILVFVLLLSCVYAQATHAETLPLSETDGVFSADELLLVPVGSDESLMLSFTNAELRSVHPLDGKPAPEGCLDLVLDFAVTNYSFDEQLLPACIRAKLTYNDQFTYHGQGVYDTGKLGMLEEEKGYFVFTLPGSAAADGSGRLILAVTVNEQTKQFYVNVSEQAKALGYDAVDADAEQAISLEMTGAQFYSEWHDRQDDAFRYLVIDAEVFNNTDQNLNILTSLTAEIRYHEKYRFPAEVDCTGAVLAPMERRSLQLVFRLPYIVVVSEDDETALTVTVNDSAKEYPFSISSALPPMHAYKVFYEELNWDEALAACEKLGGHLVTITGEEENILVKSMYPNDQKLWYGGFADQDRNWYWVTGEPFDYTDWGKDEPNNYCNQQYWLASYDGQFADSTIEYSEWGKTGYICEWDRAEDCREEERIEFDLSGFRATSPFPFTYDDVSRSASLQTRLAARTFKRLTEGAGDKTRTLIIDLSVINCSTDIKDLKDAFGATLTFRGKYTFEPVITFSSKELSPLETGRVFLTFDVPTMVLNGEDEEIALTLTVEGDERETDFLLSQAAAGIHAYHIVSGNKPIPWTDAKAACAEMGGYLATITSEEESETVSRYHTLAGYPYCWLGATQTDGVWSWITDEEWGFTKWYKNQSKSDCLLIGAESSWGSIYNNYRELMGYICEWDDVSQVPAGIDYFTAE